MSAAELRTEAEMVSPSIKLPPDKGKAASASSSSPMKRWDYMSGTGGEKNGDRKALIRHIDCVPITDP